MNTDIGVDGLVDSKPPPTVGQLFMGFLGLGLIGFGGMLPYARRTIVEDQGWLSGAEFTELFGLCQFMPGGNICNMSVAIGHQYRGFTGACASLIGLMAAPTVIVLGLGTLYEHYRDEPHISHLLAGLTAAVAGLLISTALKMAAPLRARPIAIVFAALCFGLITLLHVPLVMAMAGLAPLSILAAWRFAS